MAGRSDASPLDADVILLYWSTVMLEVVGFHLDQNPASTSDCSGVSDRSTTCGNINTAIDVNIVTVTVCSVFWSIMQSTGHHPRYNLSGCRNRSPTPYLYSSTWCYSTPLGLPTTFQSVPSKEYNKSLLVLTQTPVDSLTACLSNDDTARHCRHQ